MRCLRSIIGVNLVDWMPNDTILKIIGQPPIENVLRRNILRWFGHVNRMFNASNESSVVKKITFSYSHGEKRPRHIGIRKRWEDKVQKCMEELNIKNWRRQVVDRNQWRDLINQNSHSAPVYSNIKEIVFKYKKRANKRRKERIKQKVTEMLTKSADNQYSCPGCKRKFKPQGITNHVKFCTSEIAWCKKNRIK